MQIHYGNSRFRSSGFSFQQSAKLVNLLNQCPERMKADSIKDRVIETIGWIVGSYGFILPFWYAPKSRSVSFSEFAEAIAAIYSLENPRNDYAVSFLRELSDCAVEINP